jgi:hypothetical protein
VREYDHRFSIYRSIHAATERPCDPNRSRQISKITMFRRPEKLISFELKNVHKSLADIKTAVELTNALGD